MAKLNMIRNNVGLLTGYINVDPYSSTTDKEYDIRTADYRHLDSIVDNSECTEIIANDITDYMEPHEVERIIHHWAGKIRRGGILVVIGIDIMEVAKGLAYGTLLDKTENPFQQIQKANMLLHNAGGEIWNGRRHNLSLDAVVHILGGLAGFKLEQKTVNDYRYCVVVRRTS